MTAYFVHWTDTVTTDRRVTTVHLANAGTADTLAPIIAAAALGGVCDEGRVHIDFYETTDEVSI